MTFSVDSDFWLFQPGARQDALTRHETSGGRGKEFASSLFGVSQGVEAPGMLAMRAESSVHLLASGNLAQTFAEPDGGATAELLSTPGQTADPAVPDTELTRGPDAALTPAADTLGPGHPADEQAGDLPLEPTRAGIEMANKGGTLAEDVMKEGDLPPETLPAEVTNLITPSAAPFPSAAAIASETPAGTSGIAPAASPESGPPAYDSAAVAEASTQNTSTLSETVSVTPSPASVAEPAEIASKSQTEKADSSAIQPAKSQPTAADVTSLTEAGQPGGPVKGDTRVATPAVASLSSSVTIIDEPQGMPVAPDAAGPAAESRRSRHTSAEAEMQAAALSNAIPDATETATPQVGALSLGTPPEGNATGEATSPSIPSLSTSAGFLPGQSPAQTAVLPSSAQPIPAHSVIVATATQLPDIVARATSDGRDDRITVQLDPPELGRISIDFKFDAQGLQHVTITAESPEAMRQLRLMHFELVQALERNGLTGQNMSFQHQNPQQHEGWGQQAKLAGASPNAPALNGNGLILAADNTPHRQGASSGRLDIRL